MPPKTKIGKDQASDTAAQLKSLKEAMDLLARENRELKAKVDGGHSMINSCPCNSEKQGKVQWLQCVNDECVSPTWHASCAGFDNPKEAVIKALRGIWRCPYCVIAKFPRDDNQLDVDQQVMAITTKVKDVISQEIKQEIDNLSKLVQGTLCEIETKCLPNMMNLPKKVGNQESYANIVAQSDQGNENIVNKLAAQVVNTQKQLMADKEERQNNIIIFNVPEQDTNTKEKESSFFKSMCTKTLEMSDEPIVKISRIGNVDRPGYNRPIKVCFEQLWNKRMFLSCLHKLKNNENFSNITISHDMSKEDRLRNKELLRQAYEMNKTNQSNDFKFKVRGPPWEMKIVKVYQKQTSSQSKLTKISPAQALAEAQPGCSKN